VKPNEILTPHLKSFLASEGYTSLRVLEGNVCGLHEFAFTTGLMVGLSESSYERRYCFEHAADAIKAIDNWNGKDHPGGPWIKCKGTGIDLLNPNLANFF